MNRPFSHPALDFLLLRLRARYERARAEDTERGASAVEWVVVSAIVVAIAIGVGIVIKKALTDKADDISDKIDTSGT